MSQTLTLDLCDAKQGRCRAKIDGDIKAIYTMSLANKNQCDANEHEIFEVRSELTDMKREHAVDREITSHAVKTLDGVLKYSKVIAGILGAIFTAALGGYGLIWAFWCSEAGQSIILAALQVSVK